jgi:small-conductance mechanosensitive channel
MDGSAWQRAAIAAVVVAVALAVAKIVDRALTRRLDLPPEALTRYRVLRRSVIVAIVVVGVLSALLVIPEVRAVAGGVLASSAVAALVIGMAARSTLANFVAGILIAFTQPLRLGDEVEVDDASGTVEEIGLTYTVLGTASGERFFIPNEKLASDIIRNATIASRERLVRVTIPVPLFSDLDAVVSALEQEAKGIVEPRPDREPAVTVTDLERAASVAVVTVEAWAAPGQVADVEALLRRAAHRRLRAEGVYV